jgi:hypothetical protein
MNDEDIVVQAFRVMNREGRQLATRYMLGMAAEFPVPQPKPNLRLIRTNAPAGLARPQELRAAGGKRKLKTARLKDTPIRLCMAADAAFARTLGVNQSVGGLTAVRHLSLVRIEEL